MKQQFSVSDLDQVAELVHQYFEGLHQGDIEKLEQIFHPDAVLKAPGLRRTKAEWLKAVANREIPARMGHSFDYRILSLDLVGCQAMVKVYCPLLGHKYVDFLGLLKEAGNWLIVNKMFDDLGEAD